MMQGYLKTFVFFTLALSLNSCGEDSNKTETVDLEEFLPKSDKEYNYDEDTVSQVQEHIPDSIELYIQSKITDAHFLSKAELSNNKHFPDRLDYTKKSYHELIIDSTLYELVVWEFKDSIHSVNAFYNWMDCFGEKCKSIRIGESKWIYNGAFQLFVDDSKLIYVASGKELNQKMWSNLFQPDRKNNWNYHLYQPLKRKVKWFELKE
jgi:hypothetical protein